jgi:hypothetical protein
MDVRQYLGLTPVYPPAFIEWELAAAHLAYW